MAFNDAFKQFPALQTERLILNELKPEDAQAYHHQLNSARDAPGRPPWAYSFEAASVENARRAFGFSHNAWTKKARIRWAIRLTSEEKPIGQCELFDFDAQSRAELGYWLGVEHQNRGIMTEAIGAVISYGFDTMGLHRIYAQTSTRNVPSLAMLSKLGFVKEGVLRQHTKRDDTWDDTALMAILKSEAQTILDALISASKE